MKLKILELERGSVLEIDNTVLAIKEDYTVIMAVSNKNVSASFVDFVPIGKIIKSNLVYFPKYTKLPESSQITKVVYLGNYNFSVKHLTSLIGEFNKLAVYDQVEILNSTGASAEHPTVNASDYED